MGERDRDRERQRVRECVHVLLQYKAVDTFYISGLRRNRDDSDQFAHLRKLIRHFFFRISSEMDVQTLDYRKYKQIPINVMWRGIIMRKYIYITI